MPASHSAVITWAAPGSAVTRPAATSAAYAASNSSLACCAVASSPRISRKTAIFDWPMVACTIRIASSCAALPRAGPNRSRAAVNAAITLPSSATVVPAISRHAIVMLVIASLPGVRRPAVSRTPVVRRMSAPRWPGRRSCRGRPAR